jgi:hypothetical protein
MIEGIYQIPVFDNKNTKYYPNFLESMKEMLEAFMKNFGHYPNGRILVEGTFRFQKDATGGYWIDFRPTHPSR